MAYDGNLGEMLVMTSISDLNKLVLTFCLKSDSERSDQSQHLKLAKELVSHQGEGSIYDCLKSLNYLTDMEIDTNSCIVTPMRFITFEYGLTDLGLENYQ